VSVAREMLQHEKITLAIMKWRLSHTTSSDRWHPILRRLEAEVSARVDGLGGDSREIEPSPNGLDHSRNQRFYPRRPEGY